MEKLHHDTGRNIVRGKLIFPGQFRHRRRHGPMPADDTLVHAGIGHVLQSPVFLVADAKSVNKRQPAGLFRFAKAPAQGFEELVGNSMARPRASDGDGLAVLDQRDGFFGAY